MIVVFDTNLFVSAAISQTGLSRRRWVLLAQRKFQLAVTKEILVEYETAADALGRRPGKYFGVNWRPLLSWIQSKAIHFEPAPLGKKHSRDPDEIFSWRAPWPAARR
jgi:predicted nucleic acid-binding protein